MRGVLLLLMMLWSVVSLGADPQAACVSPEYRQFDFWIGQWQVTDPQGKPAGSSHIESVLDGCALHESWTGASGFRGNSYSAYDASRGVWHQTWVDVSGTVLRLDGGLQGPSMVLEGQRKTPKGLRRDRISWTPLDGGAVRQHWEVTADDGKTWKTVFDGHYAPVTQDSRASAR